MKSKYQMRQQNKQKSFTYNSFRPDLQSKAIPVDESQRRILRVAVTVFVFAAWVFASLAPLVAQQDQKKKSENERGSTVDQFVRISVDGDNQPVAMETSVVRFEGVNKEGDKFFVDLIGVVHVGEKKYYEQLNDLFKQYDSLLYELVAPEGTVVPKGGRTETGGNPIALLQKGMQSALGLEFQLDHIDYTKRNFVHADMSPEEFVESMNNNNESLFKTFFRAMGQGMAKQKKQRESGGVSTDAEMLMAAMSGDKKKLRLAMAKQMQDLESGMLMFQGENGSTIIHHRNRKALSVMEKEIAAGKTKIGVFYGAGHLPDMQDRLLKDFNMKRGGTSWLKAWNLSSK